MLRQASTLRFRRGRRRPVARQALASRDPEKGTDTICWSGRESFVNQLLRPWTLDIRYSTFVVEDSPARPAHEQIGRASAAEIGKRRRRVRRQAHTERRIEPALFRPHDQRLTEKARHGAPAHASAEIVVARQHEMRRLSGAITPEERNATAGVA